MDNIPNGVLPDSRPLDRQALDHRHEDLYGGLPAVWTEKPQDKWFTTSQRNQGTSFSCVAQTSVTAMESIISDVESASIYKLRAGGLLSEGMSIQNCADILYNTGTVLEVVTPSQFMTESQMNAIVLPKTMTVKITGYRTISLITIDAIAEAVQAYGNCWVVFSVSQPEWIFTPVYLGGAITSGHALCATDFTLRNGVKTLICMDSAGKSTSPTGVRLITEDFLSHRCKGALYVLGVKAVPIPPPPPPTPSYAPFLTNLHYGMTSPEVARLQGALRQLGYFTYPTDTGYYGLVTMQAVLAFQLERAVITNGIQSVWGSFWGQKSMVILNAILGSD